MTEHGWAQRFFDSYVALHREEATTLGLSEHDGELSDVSPDGHAARAQLFARTLEVLGDDASLDARVVRSICEHELDAHDAGDDLGNVELALLPFAALRFQELHAATDDDRARLFARLARLPSYLAGHRRSLELARARGVLPVRGVATEVSTLVRGAADAVASMPSPEAEPAARALREHADALSAHVEEGARDTGVLGATRVERRLVRSMQLQSSPDALVSDARACLEEAQRALVDAASRLARRSLTGFAEARELARAYESTPLCDRASELVPAYEALLARASERAADAFDVPPAGAVRVTPMGDSYTHLGHAQNWPAPPLRSGARADFLVRLDAGAHPRSAAQLLTAHEAVPGHGLQSLGFARAFAGARAPVRLLRVHDDVAGAHGHFGAMLSIEGWATYAEERMRGLGYYDSEGDLFAIVVRAIRAARVVVDLGLHTGAMSIEEGVRFLIEEACMSPAAAARELSRYQRIPLQALTYLTGARMFERARERAAALPGFDERRFHARLIAEGPVLPGTTD